MSQAAYARCCTARQIKQKAPAIRKAEAKYAVCHRTGENRSDTPVRPKKHMPRNAALKRHFRGYVTWQTQLDTAPGKRSRIKRRARQQATAGPNGRMEPAAITLRYLCARRRALRSVLRALPIFHHLNYLLASRLPHLHRNVTIAAANSGLARIFIGGCESARWLA